MVSPSSQMKKDSEASTIHFDTEPDDIKFDCLIIPQNTHSEGETLTDCSSDTVHCEVGAFLPATLKVYVSRDCTVRSEGLSRKVVSRRFVTGWDSTVGVVPCFRAGIAQRKSAVPMFD